MVPHLAGNARARLDSNGDQSIKTLKKYKNYT